MRVIGNINDNKPKKTNKKLKIKYLWQLAEKDKPKKRVIGIWSDTHFPFTVEGYLEFVIETFVRYGVSDIVCDGDMVDNHSLSRHDSHPEAVGTVTEKELSQALVDKYVEVFPVVKYVLGNHCRIPQRQAATLGLPEGYLKSFSELWNLPDEWDVAEKHIINKVMYTHGTGSGGKDGAINAAIRNRMSTVIGHSHAYAGIKFNNNGLDTIFGMNVGCGVDNDTYAMAYGKDYPNKPVISCGIVFDNCNGMVVVMKGEK